MAILLSGRPLIVTKHLPQWDASIAAWLPGSEGQGVVDVLFGDYHVTGKLALHLAALNGSDPLECTGRPR